MNINKRRLSSSVCACLLLVSGAATAQPGVDQSSPVADPIQFTWALGGIYNQVLYQSLTVGGNGRLHELRLPIGCASGEINLEIYTADPSTGLPAAGSPRLSRTYPATDFPEVVTGDLYSLPLSPRYGVTAGDVIVFVLSNPTGSCGIAWSNLGDPYIGGTGNAEDTVNGVPVPLSLSSTDDLPFEFVTIRSGPRRP